MKFRAKINKTISKGNVKASADVVIDDAFAVHNVLIMEGKNGLSVVMPGEKKQDKDGNIKYEDIAHPIKAETRRELDKAVLEAYQTYTQAQNANTQSMGISM
jgi:stage V sporulation protein G